MIRINNPTGRSLSLRAVAFMALLTLTGCDDVSIVEDQTTGKFSPSEYASDAAQGPIPVAVFGNALGAGDERLAAAVIDRLQGADWAPHAEFTLDHAGNGPSGGSPEHSVRMYSYVLMFNGPTNATAAALCARRTLPPSPAAIADSTTIRLVAGLCRNDEIATAVTGRAYRVRGFDDERFERLIVGVMQTLTRPNQPQINR